MAKIITPNPPGIRSFVHLTAEEALKEFGGGIGFVGRSFAPAPQISAPSTAHAPAAKLVKKKGKKTNG